MCAAETHAQGTARRGRRALLQWGLPALIVATNAFDLLATYVNTPDLRLEGNPVFKFGSRFNHIGWAEVTLGKSAATLLLLALWFGLHWLTEGMYCPPEARGRRLFHWLLTGQTDPPAGLGRLRDLQWRGLVALVAGAFVLGEPLYVTLAGADHLLFHYGRVTDWLIGPLPGAVVALLALFGAVQLIRCVCGPGRAA